MEMDETGFAYLNNEPPELRVADKVWGINDIFKKPQDEHKHLSMTPSNVLDLYSQLKYQDRLTDAGRRLTAALQQMKIVEEEQWANMNDQQRRAFKAKQRMFSKRKDRETKEDK